MKTTLVGLFATALLAAACGSESDPGPDPDGPDAGDEADTLAPVIESISPADGTAGVRADATIIVVFSESMDPGSVENSIDASDLGDVSFVWSNEDSRLEIIPSNSLEYAEGDGNDPDAVTAKRYVVTLGTGGTDYAGNNVEVGIQTVFTTLKSMTTSFERDNALTGAGTPSGVFTDADDFIQVGDDAAGALAQASRGYITMDLAELPASTVEITAAKLSGYQLAEIGSPYAELADGTGLILDHGTFMLGDSVSENHAFNMEPLSQVGVFARSGDTALGADVTAQVRDDVANREARSDRSQYRLRFSTFTNLDAQEDRVYIGRDELSLDVIYLAP